MILLIVTVEGGVQDRDQAVPEIAKGFRDRVNCYRSAIQTVMPSNFQLDLEST